MRVVLVIVLVVLCERTTAILNGEKAKNNEFPFAVSLEQKFGWNGCSGALIGAEWVLTAAHCVYDFRNSLESIKALIGTDAIYQTFEHQYRFKNLIIHENFNFYTMDNDIALLQLEKPVTFSRKIQAIERADFDVAPGDNVTVVGWGSTIPNSILRPSNILHWTRLNVISNDDCRVLMNQTVYAFHPLLDKEHMCTFNPGTGPYLGDGGSPAIVQNKDSAPILVGFVSWGKFQSSVDNVPDVYTKVSAYNQWIDTYTN